MAPAAGTYHLGPDDGTLSLHTRRTGAAAKAGHDLLIDVTAWEGTLTVGDAPGDVAVEVVADTGSLKVREGHGGVQALGDDDKANIETTIHDEILKRDRITFRSTGAEPGADGRVTVHGDMTMLGVTAPLDIDLALGGGGAVAGSAVVAQSRWGMKPYSILFGTLKVVDEVGVELRATLPGG
ncbi:MAG TPA: YceI family protein [Miltoncostaeaceae bacterium]|nr:YceI family protein [Miltoncostaeaceae bacterium]